MKTTPERFDEAIALIMKARDAYFSTAVNASWRIIEQCVKEVRNLNETLEAETIIQMRDRRGDELTSADIHALQNFNDQLAELEKKIGREVRMITDLCKQRLKSTDESFLTCYHLRVDLQYHIGDDDPAFSDDRDNCIATSKHASTDVMNDGNNWNDMKNTDLLLAHQKHCWLFHDLYDNAHLSWIDILRIRHVYAHITVCYGNDVHIQMDASRIWRAAIRRNKTPVTKTRLSNG